MSCAGPARTGGRGLSAPSRCGERYPLAQAQGFAFMGWLEDHAADPEQRLELLLTVESVLRDGPPRLRAELRASADCVGRDYSPRPDTDPLPLLAGEPVRLYAPQACAGYPGGYTGYLDEWTETALAGAGRHTA